jgi:hypothetical protein
MPRENGNFQLPERVSDSCFSAYLICLQASSYSSWFSSSQPLQPLPCNCLQLRRYTTNIGLQRSIHEMFNSTGSLCQYESALCFWLMEWSWVLQLQKSEACNSNVLSPVWIAIWGFEPLIMVLTWRFLTMLGVAKLNCVLKLQADSLNVHGKIFHYK